MLPVLITIRDIENSEFLENYIRDKAHKLSQFFQRIGSCRIVVEVPQKHKRQGKMYGVHIDLAVPGKELVSTRKADEDVYVALKKAFHAIERQLDKYAKRRRGDVKTHEVVNRGVIARLFLDEGYGFIHGIDGNEYYFNAANIVDFPLDKLFVGNKVQFLELPSSEGMQAHRVMVEG